MFLLLRWNGRSLEMLVVKKLVLRGSARVNEMHADTEQLCMRQTHDRAEGRGARKVGSLRPKQRCPCAITHRSAGSQSPEDGDLPPVPRPTPDLLQKQAALPLSPRATMARLWRNGPGAYLNTFQLFRGSRSEIIETMVERLGSTGRGRGCGGKRSKEKAAQRL